MRARRESACGATRKAKDWNASRCRTSIGSAARELPQSIMTMMAGLIWLRVGEGASGGEIRLLRNLGAGNWADATKDAKLDAVKLSQADRRLRRRMSAEPVAWICW